MSASNCRASFEFMPFLQTRRQVPNLALPFSCSANCPCTATGHPQAGRRLIELLRSCHLTHQKSTVPRAHIAKSDRMCTRCAPASLLQAIPQAGQRLIELPRSCHLTYDESSDPRVLQLIQQVPEELWGAKLALQVSLGVSRIHLDVAGLGVGQGVLWSPAS